MQMLTGHVKRLARQVALLSLGLAPVVLLSTSVPGDRIEWLDESGRHSCEGKVLAQTAEEVLVLLPDGQMLLLPSEQVQSIQVEEVPPKPLSPAELSQHLLREFGPNFATIITNHYVIVYDTDPRFANAVANLLERLFSGFTRYFTLRGFQVQRAEFPLVAVLFRSRAEFEAYARRELNSVDPRINGFYSLETNRLALYYVPPRGRFTRSPVSPENVSTVAHEGAHQLTFNLGFVRRFSDPPLWVLEGVATLFEVPAGSSGRWSGVGQLNRARLNQFLKFVRRGRPPDSLQSLITSDDRLQTFQQAVDAYAEAWALTYFLVRTRPKAFFAYVQHLGKKPYLHRASAEERLSEFEHFFGPLDQIDAELVAYMQRIARFR